MHLDHTLKGRARVYMTSQGLSLGLIKRIDLYIDSSVTIAITSLAHMSPPIKETITPCTSYAVSINDISHEFSREMNILRSCYSVVSLKSMNSSRKSYS